MSEKPDDKTIVETSFNDTQELMGKIIDLINDYTQKSTSLNYKTRFLVASRALNGAWLRWNLSMGLHYDKGLKEIEEAK